MLLYQKKPKKSVNHIYSTLPLEDWNPNVNTSYAFYYNWCDHIYGIEFPNFLDESHINFLKDNPQIKVIYDFNGEPIVESVLNNIILTSEKWNLNPNQIIVTVSNKLQTQFVEQRITNDTIKTIEHNCDIKNLVIAPDNRNVPFKKFSTMCRIHRPWRSYMLCRLKEQGLLEDFHYSFVGCYQDMDDAIKKTLDENVDITVLLKTGNWKTISEPFKIKRDLEKVCNYKISKEVSEFIDACPHYIEKDNFETDAETPQELLKSNVHLIIENGFFDLKESSYTTRSIEIGEKTWKAVITLKPFLVFSDAHYLKNIKKLGFKTFSPYINEDYDKEVDPKNRAEMIIKEIERLNNLPVAEFNKLLENCKHIAEHNFQLYQTTKSNTLDFLEIDFTTL